MIFVCSQRHDNECYFIPIYRPYIWKFLQLYTHRRPKPKMCSQFRLSMSHKTLLNKSDFRYDKYFYSVAHDPHTHRILSYTKFSLQKQKENKLYLWIEQKICRLDLCMYVFRSTKRRATFLFVQMLWNEYLIICTNERCFSNYLFFFCK